MLPILVIRPIFEQLSLGLAGIKAAKVMHIDITFYIFYKKLNDNIRIGVDYIIYSVMI